MAFEFFFRDMGLEPRDKQTYKAGKEIQPNERNDIAANPYYADSDMHSGIGNRISKLGTPIFADVVLSKNEQNEKDGMQLTNCLVEVTQSKNIVKTVVQGRDGTVKEYISDGDYIVKLSGYLTNTFSSLFPVAEFKQFLELMREKKSLKVVSQYLLMFKIYNLVVEDYGTGQEIGRQNRIRFEITCSSDDPLMLQKKKDVQS